MRNSSGNTRIPIRAISTVPMPPMSTAGTAPNQAAVTPDSNSPSVFDVPMNSELTAVGDVADDRRQQHHRHELHQPDQSQVERAAGEIIDLPADRHGLHLVGNRPGDARAPEEGEGAVPRQARQGGGEGHGHRGSLRRMGQRSCMRRARNALHSQVRPPAIDTPGGDRFTGEKP
jgi:hypothetical protein